MMALTIPWISRTSLRYNAVLNIPVLRE
jgi:hypothetical protein